MNIYPFKDNTVELIKSYERKIAELMPSIRRKQRILREINRSKRQKFI